MRRRHARTSRRVSAAIAMSVLGAIGVLSGCSSKAATTSDVSTTDNPPSVAVAPSNLGPPATPSPVPTTATHSGADEIPLGLLSGNLGVRDQSSNGRTVTLNAEIDGAPGWVVIRSDDHGKPGTLLGVVHRANGQHGDTITITLRRPVRTGYCWAIVHIDAGRVGRYEYPGADTVLNAAGAPLTRRFLVTVA